MQGSTISRRGVKPTPNPPANTALDTGPLYYFLRIYAHAAGDATSCISVFSCHLHLVPPNAAVFESLAAAFKAILAWLH